MGAAVIQANMVVGNPLVVPIVSAVIGGLMSFAVLKTTVRVVERDLNHVKDKLDDVHTRVARIEGKLEADA